MTDGLHGHEGPLKEVVRIIGGEERNLIRCETCHVAVYTVEEEKLEEYDCEKYAELRGEAAEDLRETWD